MTCIVGVEEAGRVIIGGDSAGMLGWLSAVRSDEKVFRSGPFVMGFTSSFRMGQLLRYALEVPQQSHTQTDSEFLCTTFIDAVRECLGRGGLRKTEHGVEEGGTFLLGYRRRLYEVQDDFQVASRSDGIAAAGCGRDIAYGALHATAGREPRERALAALRAAEALSGGVCGPFTVLEL